MEPFPLPPEPPRGAICPHCGKTPEPFARYHERGDPLCQPIRRHKVTLHVYDDPHQRHVTHTEISEHESESAAIAYAYRASLRGNCDGWKIEEIANG